MDECGLYADPQLYDRLFPGGHATASMADAAHGERLAASERFYVEETVKNGGPVLELGCGSGRLTVLIAQSGIETTGADLSRPMLEAARAKVRAAGVAVQFVEADMRSFDLENRFAAILIAGNSLLHLLSTVDLQACLAGVRRHLTPGGRLFFDISKWDLARLARDPAARYRVLSVPDPERGEITVEESGSYDAAQQVRHVVWHLSAPGAHDFRTIQYHLRVIFPQELLLLLESAGFDLEARYGEFTREPFQSSSPRQVCICTPKA